MKKIILSTILFYMAIYANGQAIQLQPGGAYNHIFKTTNSFYADFSTTQSTASQYFYVNAPATGISSLGTTIGYLNGNTTQFTMNGTTNLALQTGGTNRLFINATGRVGINYLTPNAQFEVFQTGGSGIGWGSYLRNSKIATASNGSHATVNDNFDAIGVAGFAANANASSSWKNIGILGTTAVNGFDNIGVYGYQKGAYDGSNYAYGLRGEVEQTGTGAAYGLYTTSYGTGTGTKYGIYAAASGSGTRYAGYFSGNVYIGGDFYYTGSFSATSDEKLKTNIKSMDSALDKILALNPSTYEYKTTEYQNLNLSKGTHYGFTAQGVQKVLPELVTEKTISNATPDNRTDQSTTTYLSVNYIEIIPVLTKAIQEQQALIKELQAEINKLKK